jgi:hypothetical protein
LSPVFSSVNVTVSFGHKHRLGPQGVAQAFDGKAARVKIARVGPEADGRAGIALADGAGRLPVPAALFPPAKQMKCFLPSRLDFHFQAGRQGVDHRHPHAVQAAGKLVVLVGKLGPGVQFDQDHLHAGDAFLRVDIRGHAAAVVGHAQGPVRMENHVDAAGKAGDGLVDAVVDHLLGQVVGPLGVGVHPRPPANRVQAL